MNCLPVIERELRVRSRQWSSYLLRMLVAGAGMVVILLTTVDRYMRRDEQSLVMLMGSAAITMIVTQLSGCFFTADAISSEKREGTLGLLFLTPLKSRDVMLGKLASAVIPVFFGMLALLPVFFIPMLNGGVTVAFVVRVFAALAVSLFLSLSVGLLVSTMGREAKSTALGTLVVMLLLNAIPLVYVFVCEAVFRNTISPFGLPQIAAWATLMFAVEDLVGRCGVSLFWGAVAAQAVMACGVWLGAVICLGRLARRGDFEFAVEKKEKKRGVIRRFVSWLFRPSRWKVGALGSGPPHLWAAMRGWSDTWWLRWFWRLLWFGFLAMFVSALFASRRNADELIMGSLWMLAAMHMFTKMQLAFETTRQLSADRRAGCLELLLSTPLEPSAILQGVDATTKKAFWFRIAGLIVVNVALVLTVAIAARHLRMSGDMVDLGFIVLIGGAILARQDYLAMMREGAVQALMRKTHLRAALGTFGMVIAIPWLVLILALVGAALFRADDEDVKVIMVLWVVACVIWDGVLNRKANRVLKMGIRKLSVGEKP